MKKYFGALALLPGMVLIADTSPNPNTQAFQFSADASFTYWYAKEDGLNIAESSLLRPSGEAVFPPNISIFSQDFGYKPGFKLGLGLESTNQWNLHAEYTYYRGTTTTSKEAPSNTSSLPATGTWYVNEWFLQTLPLFKQSLSGTHISSTWKLGMDLGDITFSRPYENDKGFCFSPFGGLRTVWIRQHMNISLTQAAAAIGASNLLPPQPLQSLNSSHSWALGPRVGTEAKYGLPMGFRIEGLFAASLLYTQFTSIKHSEERAATFITFPLQSSLHNYNCVRPVMDINLGLGWEMKLYQKYHIDFAASYDFSYFWGQNMMRSILDHLWEGSGSGDNDLYFQGLTLTGSFRF